MTRMTPSEAFVEALVAQGVTEMFGIAGSAFMDAMDLFPSAGIANCPDAADCGRARCPAAASPRRPRRPAPRSPRVRRRKRARPED